MATRVFDSKLLASGQVANSETAIYTAPSGGTDKAAYLTKVTFYNTNTTAEVVRVWVKPAGGTARRIPPRLSLLQDESADIVADGKSILLGPGDALEAATTTASKVDYAVFGSQETEV